MVAEQGRLSWRRNTLTYVESIPEAGPGLNLQEFQGFFIKVEASREGLKAWRDHAGPIPLLYSRLGETLAMAKSRHSLPGEPSHLKPGRMLEIASGEVSETSWYRPEAVQVEDPVEALAQALEEAAELIPFKPAISFSGGLDSSLITLLAQGKKPLCVVVGLRGSPDMERAGKAADLLGAELLRVYVDEVRVKEVVSRLIGFLPSHGSMDLSLATVFHLSAHESGRECLVVGQGADELFGGYMKYASALAGKGPREAERLMLEDLAGLYLGLERDEVSVALARSTLITPYLHRRVYQLGRQLALDWKLRRVDGELVRKYALRIAAERLGLPRELAWMPKKAAQYGSRVQRLVEKVLKPSF